MKTSFKENPSLIYETGSDYDRWQRLLYIGLPAVTFVIGLVLWLYEEQEGALTLFGITVFYGLLFHSIMPRKFQLFEDKLRVVLGNPFAFSIRYETMKEVRPAAGIKSHFYMGMRWATSSYNVVEIVRSKGMNMVISPSNRVTFLEQANDAIKSYQRKFQHLNQK
jgi:hypothetical protein